jgi:hypothetical protein
MTIRIAPGAPARRSDRHAARATRALLVDELARVRAGALAWRNGLGGLLVGLVGFSLIRGRSDVTQLSPPAAAVAGVLLLAALIVGSVAAVLLMRAAHGRPWAVGVGTLVSRSAEEPTVAGRLAEATSSARALARGVFLSFGCAALLCAAVAVTWYGPVKDGPRVEVRLADGTVHCGAVVGTSGGGMTLRTARGTVTLDLAEAVGLTAVAACP